MTLQSFYRRVPYTDLTIEKFGDIRHCGDPSFCVIDVAGGDWHRKDGGIGLTKKDRDDIITAADSTLPELDNHIAYLKNRLSSGNKTANFYESKKNRQSLVNQLYRYRRARKIREVFERRIAQAQGK